MHMVKKSVASKKQLSKKQKYLYRGVIALVVIFFSGIVVAESTKPTTPELPLPPLKELAAAKGIALGNFAVLRSPTTRLIGISQMAASGRHAIHITLSKWMKL